MVLNTKIFVQSDESLGFEYIDFDVPESNINLEPHIKEIGEYDVQVKFAEEALAQIKLTVLPETPLSEEALAAAQEEQPIDDAADQSDEDEPSDD